jgi:hypothetical protein
MKIGLMQAWDTARLAITRSFSLRRRHGDDAVTLNLAHDRALWILDLRQSLRESSGADPMA